MFRAALLFLACLVVTGCVSTKITPIDSSSRAILAGKSVIIVRRNNTDFYADTVASKAVTLAVGGILGAAAGHAIATAAGKKVKEQNGLVDPTPAIAENLAGFLQETHGMIIRDETPLVKSAGMKGVLASARGSDYALEVMTKNWGYFASPGGAVGNHFPDFRLIDVKTGEEIADGTCVFQPEKHGRRGTSLDVLLANGADRLKSDINAAVEYCTGQFREGLR